LWYYFQFNLSYEANKARKFDDTPFDDDDDDDDNDDRIPPVAASTTAASVPSPATTVDRFSVVDRRRRRRFPTNAVLLAIALFLIGTGLLTTAGLMIRQDGFTNNVYPLLVLGSITFLPGKAATMRVNA
jgi:hypothetical protein